MALTLYFRPEPAAFRDGLIGCWEEFLADWEEGLSWYADEDLGKFRPLTPKRLARPVERLMSDKPMPFYAWTASSGATYNSAGALSCECVVHDPSVAPAWQGKEL